MEKKKYHGDGWCDFCNMENARGVKEYDTKAGKIYICRKCRSIMFCRRD